MHGSRRALLPVLAVAMAVSGSGALSPDVRPLPFFYDLYTFRGPAGSTVVLSTFAVEAGRLDTEGAGSRIRYRFSVTLVLADTALRTVSNTHDTVFVDVYRPFPDEHLLHTSVEVLARPSGSTRRRVIMMDATTPGVGQLYADPFPIPDYSGDRLMLSDIALGRPGAATGWKRGAATLGILPTTRFPPDVFDVYYEIYNLPAGHEYATEITIERPDSPGAAGAEPVRLRFTGRSGAGPDGLLAELRRVDASLARGPHRLTVTITDLVSGDTASRSRPFEVEGSARGATMVASLRRTHGSNVR